MTTADRLATALADRCRVERELGAGGMVSWHLAHDLKHDRDVAMKVCTPISARHSASSARARAS